MPIDQIYTGQSTTCPGGPAATSTLSLDTPPAITGLKVRNRKFAVVAAKGKGASSSKLKFGTTFRYTLSEDASVRFKVDRKLPGRVLGGKCKPLSAANGKRKHCVLFKKASPPLNVKGKQGANKTAYSGRRKGGKALTPGRYRAHRGRDRPRRWALGAAPRFVHGRGGCPSSEPSRIQSREKGCTWTFICPGRGR